MLEKILSNIFYTLSGVQRIRQTKESNVIILPIYADEKRYTERQ